MVERTDDVLRIVFNSWRDRVHPLAGGSEVLIDRLAAGLTERGHDVTLRCARPIGEHPYRSIAAGGRLTQFVRWPGAYVARHRDADLVVDVANGMAYFTPLFRRAPTVCFVHHVHQSHWAQWFSPPVAAFGRFLEREAMPRAYRRNLFVTVSPSTAQNLVELGVDSSRIRIVTNGVEVPSTFRPEAAEPTFLALSRLVPHKRFDLILDVWRRVRPRTGGRLLIAGDGPERARLERMNVPGVEFLGAVSESDKDRLMGEAWLFLHPAEVEGWGLVIMEAAARATPTLGFRTLGVRDSVAHGATGWLVDDVDEFEQSWVALTTDPTRRLALGAAARERAKCFTWERSVDQFEAVAREATSTTIAATTVPAPAPTRRPHPATVRLEHADVPGHAVDVTLVIRASSVPDGLRSMLASWRADLGPLACELVIVDRDGLDAAQSSVLIGALLAGFERAVPATTVGTMVTATVAGAVVVLVDADSPSGVADVLAAVASRRGATTAPVHVTSSVGEGGSEVIRWGVDPLVVHHRREAVSGAGTRG